MARLWLPMVLLLGCAHAPTVSSERVVQLPPQSREQIVRARQGVDVADQNVTAAKVALDQSQKFRDIADRELDAAKARLDASRAGIALGRSARSQRTIRDSRADYNLAMRELFAARAKKDYADRIVDLRRAELDLRRSERTYANSDFEYVKYAQLEQEGMAGDLKQSDFENARIRAQNEVARDRKRVADLAGSVEQLRTAWMQRDQDYETASRGSAIIPPPPPRALDYSLPSEQMANPPPTFNPPPAGGVNEGPSAPQDVPQN